MVNNNLVSKNNSTDFAQNLIGRVMSYIDEHNLFAINKYNLGNKYNLDLKFGLKDIKSSKKRTVIIGLSGGPDSVCLLHILAQIKDQYNLNLIAAHLDHEWRKNSADDIIFCQNLARKFNIDFYYAKASQINLDKKKLGSPEELGRLLRRKFFEQLAQRFNSEHIALAHHKDDQIETFLIRLIRGSSINGLASIRPQNGLYVRPLLNITKQEIYDYLSENKLEYLIDSTNAEQVYLRNKIRHFVIPALGKSDARFSSNIIRAIDNISKTDAFISRQVDQAYKDITKLNNLNFPDNKLKNYNLNSNNSSNISPNNISLNIPNKLNSESNSSLNNWQDSASNYLNLSINPDFNLGINLDLFLKLDPYLQKPVLIKWLLESEVNFLLTEKFLDEILRYLKFGKSNKHQLGEKWQIIKQKNIAYISKLESKS